MIVFDGSVSVLGVIGWVVTWGCIGAIVGDAYKKQASVGAVACGVLGPVGLVYLITLRDDRERLYWDQWERQVGRVEKHLLKAMKEQKN